MHMMTGQLYERIGRVRVGKLVLLEGRDGEEGVGNRESLSLVKMRNLHVVLEGFLGVTTPWKKGGQNGVVEKRKGTHTYSALSKFAKVGSQKKNKERFGIDIEKEILNLKKKMNEHRSTWRCMYV